MSDNTTEVTTKSRFAYLSFGKFVTLIGIVIFVWAFVFGYFQLGQINQQLAQKIIALEQFSQKMQESLQTQSMQLQTVQQALSQDREKVLQQEKLFQTWQQQQKGHRDAWQVAEAQYLVKLANDQILYTHDTNLALTLLLRAEEVLAASHDIEVNNLQKSVQLAIANFKAKPLVQNEEVYLKLAALIDSVNNLQLPETPLQATQPELHSFVELPWWDRAWQRTKAALAQIVLVHYTGSNQLPLIMPEEKTYLIQNMQTQLQTAMWACLQHKPKVYQQALQQLTRWIKQYAVADAASTQQLQTTLVQLQALDFTMPTISLSETLQLFDRYFAHANQDAN